MSSFGKWSRSGIPHKGWTCIDIEDLGSPSQICEMCEHQEIRYVHYMQHSEYQETLECGCDCAGKMEENSAAATHRENKMKNRAARRKNWPLLKSWRMSAKGNATIRKDGYRITVFKKPDGSFGAVISNTTSGYEKFARRRYETEEAAKFASFDVLMSLTN